MDIKELRRDFSQGTLVESDLPKNPLALLQGWLQFALDRGVPDANGMALATLDQDGYPTSRIVLLRDVSEKGLSFFTNYRSAKAAELAKLPKASVTFFWSTLERQIRVRGIIEKLSDQESDAYFASRPRPSQIGAWASPQSQVLSGREELEQFVAKETARFGDGVVPRPPHWGGYLLVPDCFEFWQGRPSRLHDRLRARPCETGWTWERLAP